MIKRFFHISKMLIKKFFLFFYKKESLKYIVFFLLNFFLIFIFLYNFFYCVKNSTGGWVVFYTYLNHQGADYKILSWINFYYIFNFFKLSNSFFIKDFFFIIENYDLTDFCFFFYKNYFYIVSEVDKKNFFFFYDNFLDCLKKNSDVCLDLNNKFFLYDYFLIFNEVFFCLKNNFEDFAGFLNYHPITGQVDFFFSTNDLFKLLFLIEFNLINNKNLTFYNFWFFKAGYNGDLFFKHVLILFTYLKNNNIEFISLQDFFKIILFYFQDNLILNSKNSFLKNTLIFDFFNYKLDFFLLFFLYFFIWILKGLWTFYYTFRCSCLLRSWFFFSMLPIIFCIVFFLEVFYIKPFS